MPVELMWIAGVIGVASFVWGLQAIQKQQRITVEHFQSHPQALTGDFDVPTNSCSIGNCSSSRHVEHLGVPRTQIAKRYAVNWCSLRLTVDPNVDSWTVRVQYLGAHKPLYEAQRRSLDEAKVGGLEFAMFHVVGGGMQDSPEKLARALAWKEQY